MFSQLSATFVTVAHQFGLAGQSVTATDPALPPFTASPYGSHGASLYTGSLPSLAAPAPIGASPRRI